MTREASAPSISLRARQSALWVLGRYGFSAGLRLVSNTIVAGLVQPEVFGLMGLVMVLLTGLDLLSDTGIRQAIIRSSQGEHPDFIGTAWTIQALRGLVLFLLCFAISAPYAAVFDEPELQEIIPWASLTLVFTGIRSCNLFLAERRLQQRFQSIAGALAQTLGAATTIIWAMDNATVAAFVAGTLVYMGSFALLSHLLPGPACRPRLHPASVRELLTFGRWILVSTAVFFAVSQGERIVLGKVATMHELGLFMLSITIVELVTQALGTLSTTVFFPAWSESYRKSPEHSQRKFLTSQASFCALCSASLLCIAILIEVLIRLFYPTQYSGVILLTRLSCVMTWFQLLKAPALQVAITLGHPRVLVTNNVYILIGKAFVGTLGYWLLSFPGFILGCTIAQVLALPPLYRLLRSHGIQSAKQDLLASAKFIGILALSLLFFSLIGQHNFMILCISECAIALIVAAYYLFPLRSYWSAIST